MKILKFGASAFAGLLLATALAEDDFTIVPVSGTVEKARLGDEIVLTVRSNSQLRVTGGGKIDVLLVGGGGGAGGPGCNAASECKGGAGGSGRSCDITGESVVYAGGGGGFSTQYNDPGLGGSGGGGNAASCKYVNPNVLGVAAGNGTDWLGGGDSFHPFNQKTRVRAQQFNTVASRMEARHQGGSRPHRRIHVDGLFQRQPQG